MPREAAHDKGRRYLTEGRLELTAVSTHHIAARCRGDSGVVHTLAADHRTWSCSCPCVTDQCSHLVALRLVCLQPIRFEGTGPHGVEVA